MYAILEIGSKQHTVIKGQILLVEKIDAAEGNTIDFDQVMFVRTDSNISVGRPFVQGAKVHAVIKKHVKGDKINIIKHRRRKHHMKRLGHRQNYTEIEITDIAC